MSDNPLAGISIPSLASIVEDTVDRMGKATIDLANPLQRRRLIKSLEASLNLPLQFELERAIESATKRAVSHVFKMMRDSDYQEEKRKYQTRRRERRAAQREEKKRAEQEARMEYSRRHLNISKATVQ